MLGGTLSRLVYGIQIQALPRLLYSGPTDHFGASRPCWIYGATRLDLVAWLVTRAPVDLARGLVGRPRYLGWGRRHARRLADRERTARARPAA